MLSEKRNLCLRLLKNKGFKDESMTKGGSYAIGTSTTLESNKSLGKNAVVVMEQKVVTMVSRNGLPQLRRRPRRRGMCRHLGMTIRGGSRVP